MSDILPNIPTVVTPAMIAGIGGLLWYRMGQAEKRSTARDRVLERMDNHLQRLNAAVLLLSGGSAKDALSFLTHKGGPE